MRKYCVNMRFALQKIHVNDLQSFDMFRYLLLLVLIAIQHQMDFNKLPKCNLWGKLGETYFFQPCILLVMESKITIAEIIYHAYISGNAVLPVTSSGVKLLFVESGLVLEQ